MWQSNRNNEQTLSILIFHSVVKNYFSILKMSSRWIATSSATYAITFMLIKSSNVLIFELSTWTTLSTRSPPNTAIMKNAPANKMPKNHFSSRCFMRRFPPPMNGIKQSTIADTTSFPNNLIRLRIKYKVIAATINNAKIKAATTLTEKEKRNSSLPRLWSVPYTKMAFNVSELYGYVKAS